MTARATGATRRRQDPDLDELGRGMHLAFLNAEALAEDATRLLPTSPARALSLAVLALEELGKVFLLYEAAGEVDPPRPWSERFREFRRHRVKQEVFGEYGALLYDVFRAVGLPAPEQLLPRLDAMKEAGFYVEWGGSRFASPADHGQQQTETARCLLDAVRLILAKIEARHRDPDRSRETAYWAALGRLVMGGMSDEETRRLLDQLRAGRVPPAEVRRLARELRQAVGMTREARERLVGEIRDQLRGYAQTGPGAAAPPAPRPALPSDPGEGQTGGT